LSDDGVEVEGGFFWGFGLSEDDLDERGFGEFVFEAQYGLFVFVRVIERISVPIQKRNDEIDIKEHFVFGSLFVGKSMTVP